MLCLMCGAVLSCPISCSFAARLDPHLHNTDGINYFLRIETEVTGVYWMPAWHFAKLHDLMFQKQLDKGLPAKVVKTQETEGSEFMFGWEQLAIQRSSLFWHQSDQFLQG